jgi:hypothetical protein
MLAILTNGKITDNVTCDESSADAHVMQNQIHSALLAASESGMKVVYLYNSVYGVGGPNDITTKIHELDYLENSWKPIFPKYCDLIQPLIQRQSYQNHRRMDSTVLFSIII